MPPQRKSKKFSLSTIAAYSTLLLTVMGAIAGAIKYSEDIGAWIQKIFPKPMCTVDVRYPSVVPTHLKYYYDSEGLGKEESLYWFHIKAQNKTRESLTLNVSFAMVPTDCAYVVLKSKDAVAYTLQAKEENREESISPPLEFTQYNATTPCYLKVNYKIENQRKELVRANVVEISLLPTHTVKWDLLNPEGKPVSRTFLLSSLAGWSMSKDGRLLKRVDDLEKRTHADSPEQWLKASYDDLFKGSSAVKVLPTARTYPFSGERVIGLPSEILSERFAEPLEAGLLMASMIRAAPPARQTRLTLFILPRPGGISHTLVLLAWSVPGSSEWQTIDLAKATTLEFKSNIQESEKLLRLMLAQKPEIIASLRRDGIFEGNAENSPIAISLDRAAERFQIRSVE